MALATTQNIGKAFPDFLKQPNVGEKKSFSRFVGKDCWDMFMRPLFLDELKKEIVKQDEYEIVADITQKELWSIFRSQDLRRTVADKAIVPTNVTLTFNAGTEEIMVNFEVVSKNRF